MCCGPLCAVALTPFEGYFNGGEHFHSEHSPHIDNAGPLGPKIKAEKARPPTLGIFAIFVLRLSFAENSGRHKMRNDLLTEMRGAWARLDLAARDQFFDAFLRAALRLNHVDLRAWLRRRVRQPPLGLPADLTNLTFSAADLALLDAQSKLR